MVTPQYLAPLSHRLSQLARTRLAWALPLTVLASGLFLVSPAVAQADVSPTIPEPCLTVADGEADAVAMAVRCQTQVEIADATTETDQATALPDGRVEFEHRYRPVRVERDGDWVPVDTTLRIQADGSIAPKAAAADVAFSGGGTDPMVSVENTDGEVALSSPWGALPAPTLVGNTATYHEVRPGIDLRLTADVDGFSQVFVVKTRKAAKDPALNKLNFEIGTDGLVVAASKAGNLKVADAETGRLALTASTPVMWDSDTAATNAPVAAASTETVSDSDKAQMPVTVGGDMMSITPDQEMLDAPDTKFPVYVDPSFTTYRTGFVMVTASSPTSTYFNTADDALVGSNNGVNKWRTFFNFSTATAPFVGKQVLSADLRLQEKWSGSCTPTPLDAYATYAAGSTTTWNNQPIWSTKQDTQTVAKGYSTSGMGGASACPAGEVRMDITPITQQAADRGGNITIGLRSPDETKVTYWKRFENNPKISVIYNSLPQLLTQQTDSTGKCVTGTSRPVLATNTPTLRAAYSDADQDPTTTTFEWWPLTGSAAIGSGSQGAVPAGASGAVAIPAGKLAAGASYKWHVKAYDGSSSTEWSPWCEFTVEPAAPAVTSTSYPSDTWAGGAAAAGTFRLTPAAGQTAATYVYGLNTNPPTTQVTAASDGSATITIAPGAVGIQRLYVRSINDSGVPSAITFYQFGAGRGAEDFRTRPERTMTAAETSALAALQPMALTLLKNRAAVLTGGQPVGTIPLWTGMTTQEAAATIDLQKARNELAGDNLSYTTAAVTVQDSMVQTMGNQALLWTTESSVLTPPTGSTEPANEYNADRVFVFAANGSSWKLTDEALTKAGGLPPMTEPISQFDATVQPQVQYDTTATTDQALYGGAPTVEASSEEVLPPDIAASTVGNDPMGTAAKVDDPSAGLGDTGASAAYSIQSIPTGLCYSCMVNYARKYAKKYNPSYRAFKEEDCTNFVSQALRAGGWKDDYGWYWSSDNWWYNSDHQTYTWAGADNWSRFAKKRTTHLDNVWKMLPGDVLQADWDANGTKDHTMIVTKVSKGEVYLSYHSNDELDKPLSRIIREMWTVHPSTVYYAYRT
ncbi:amidase domain-containing protein [Actinoplanes sp. NPDC049548]|uniref:amidase domain-containing protein n=1 Tax=Actinoplanes sp. NPDC049548 TaxID=3155152 RepID=UPI00341E057C